MKRDEDKNQVVIIGIGCRFPDANHYTQYWHNLKSGLYSISDMSALEESVRGSISSQHAGLLDSVDLFDAAFFNISPHEAKLMDPQQRLLLEEAWHCMEDAGVALPILQRAATGVFIGTMAVDYLHAMLQNQKEIESLTCLSNFEGTLANRISYQFNLTGESMTVNTACSSSFYALNEAYKRIKEGELDFAFAGAANLLLSDVRHTSFTKARMLTPTNYCKTFDISADGYVPGEGIAMLLLTSLHTAQENGYRIHGMIENIALNHNGRTLTLTAPDTHAQQALLATTLSSVNAQHDYIETHGTGTSLGDLIEWSSLEQAIKKPTYVGSVKTNIGHLEAAAGFAGLIKAMLMLQHQYIPQHLHFNFPNPLLDIENSQLKIAHELTPHPMQFIGINSFGSSGANAHVMVSGSPATNASFAGEIGKEGIPALLSAQSTAALRQLVAEWQQWIINNRFADIPLSDLLLTLMSGRNHLSIRAACVVHSKEELYRWISHLDVAELCNPREIHINLSYVDLHKGFLNYINAVPIAATGTGKGFLSALRLAGVIENETDSIIFKESHNRPVIPLLLSDEQIITQCHLDDQIILDLFSFRLNDLASIIQSLTTYLKLYFKQHTFKKYISRWKQVFNVLDIDFESLVQNDKLLPDLTINAIRLLLVSAQSSLNNILGKWKLTNKSLWIIEDITFIRICTLLNLEILTPADCLLFVNNQLTPLHIKRIKNAIYTNESARSLFGDGEELTSHERESILKHYLHQPNGDVLTLKFANEMLVNIDLSPDSHPCSVMEAMVKIWEHGIDLDWKAAFPHQVFNHISLPNYPFQGESHWFKEQDHKNLYLYESDYQSIEPEFESKGKTPILIMNHQAPEALISSIISLYQNNELIKISLQSQNDVNNDDLYNKIKSTLDLKTVFLFAISHDSSTAVCQSLLAVFRTIKSLIAAGYGTTSLSIRMIVNNYDNNASSAACVGFLQSIRKEYPNWRIGIIDIDLAEIQQPFSLEFIHHGKLHDANISMLRQGQCYYRILKPVSRPLQATGLINHGTYILIGGSGGIGLALAEYLMTRYQANVIITGRSILTADKLAVLERFKLNKGSLTYMQSDCLDQASLSHLIQSVMNKYGKTDAIVYLAVDIYDQLVYSLEEETLINQMQSSITALNNCFELSGNTKLVVISSIQSWRSNAGASVYAASAALKEALVAQQLQTQANVQLISLGIVEHLGLANKPGLITPFAESGIDLLSKAHFLSSFALAMASDLPYQVIANIRLHQFSSADLSFTVSDYENLLDQYSAIRLGEIFKALLNVDILNVTNDIESILQASRITAKHYPLCRKLIHEILEQYNRHYQDLPLEKIRLQLSLSPLSQRLALIEDSFSHYIEILTGKINPVTALFPEGSMHQVEKFYCGHPIADSCNINLAKAVTELVERILDEKPNRKINILEVGAGTGASTRVILPNLTRFKHQICYHFTDVSLKFLNVGKQCFAQDYPFMHFSLFNLDEEIADQDNESLQFDIIIATNALHATKDIKKTLARLKQVGRSVSYLLLNEITSSQLSTICLFGLLDGWWLTEDSWRRLPESPLLSSSQWQETLLESGFSQTHIIPGPFINGKSIQNIIMSVSSDTHHHIIPSSLRDQLLQFLKLTVESVIGNAAHLNEHTHFDEYGLDSLLITEVNAKLVKEFGKLPVTLLFELSNLASLCDYLLEHHSAYIQSKWGNEPAATTVKQANTHLDNTNDIAIVGLAFNLPGGKNADEFWELLSTGKDAFSSIPLHRWPQYQSGPETFGYATTGAFIKNIDHFDPLLFKISPHDAELMDPQERLFLQTAYQAMHDAGLAPLSLTGTQSETGVFVGVTNNYYSWLSQENWQDYRHVNTSSSYWSVPNRVSYTFNLKGPSLAVDTACSSSLTAIHMACNSLNLGECQLAVAGGVSLILHPRQFKELCDLKMLSKSMKNQSFREGADGFIYGEGVGAVVLKPLQQALMDQQRVYGIIKASAINSGGHTNGYTVPNPAAQHQVIRQAFKKSGLNASSISYLESHGTGTALGDPIEIRGLQQAFAQDTDNKQFCALGSVKSNVGHLQAAAGMAGLVKVLLQLRHQQLVPTINSEPVNNNIDFSETAFHLQTTLTNWRRPVKDGKTQPLRAGLSSFGAGGTNAHLIIEEAPAHALKQESAPDYPFTNNRYWMPQYTKDHLLNINSESSSKPEQAYRFIEKLYPQEFYLAEHCLHGKKILPGVMHLELVYRAMLKVLTNQSCFEIGIHWLNPVIALTNETISLLIFITPQGRDYQFKIVNINDEKILYSHGDIKIGTTIAVNTTLPVHLEGDTSNDFYANFRQRGWQHGASFQSVQAVQSHESTVTARIALPASLAGTVGSYQLHPSLLDGVLQTVSALQSKERHIAYIPFSVSKFIIYQPLTQHFTVIAKQIHADHEIVKYNIKLYDSNGVCLAEFIDFCMRPLETKVSEHKQSSSIIKNIVIQEICSLQKIELPQFDTHKSLGDYGFDSISYSMLAIELNEKLNLSLSPAIFFQYSSVTRLMDYLQQESPQLFSSNEKLDITPDDHADVLAPDIEDKFSIAIIGASGVLPDAQELDTFWHNLVNGKTAISAIPENRKAWLQPDKNTFPPFGGFISEIDQFDADKFGISPREAELMDPQQRLVLQFIWHAVESAGYTVAELAEVTTGTYIGVSTFDYAKLLHEYHIQDPYLASGTVHSMMANRVSYTFNWHGPSEAIDTACSSSLVALHHAISSLQQGTCQIAVMASVNALLESSFYSAFHQAGMLSPDGICKTFDKAANGYGRAEGGGAIVIKLLSQAKKDGDNILGVIRGSGINHGGRANTLTSPNPNAQTNLLREVYQKAGIDSHSISYIEAHGTGTALGDPIEVNALKQAFQATTDEPQAKQAYCALGSVKANIGHLEAASGLAGILKIVLMFKHQIIPPQANFTHLNPYIDLNGSPFFIPLVQQPWECMIDKTGNSIPRRAGVSSFGFGGSNAHVLMEEPPATYTPIRKPLPRYIFKKERYWFCVPQARHEKKKADMVSQAIFYRPHWQLLGSINEARNVDYWRKALIMTDNQAQMLMNFIRPHAEDHLHEININEKGWESKLLQYQSKLTHLCYLAGCWFAPVTGDQSELTIMQESGLHSFFKLIQALLNLGMANKPLEFKIITKHVFRLNDDEITCPYGASLHGFCQSLAREYPAWRIILIDTTMADIVKQKTHYAIANEYGLISSEPLVYRDRLKFRRQLKPIHLTGNTPVSAFRKKGVYVLLGGAGGIGLQLSQYLINEYDATCILVGKSRLSGDKLQQVNALQQLNTHCAYHQVDITDALQLSAFMNELHKTYPVIDGIIHLAMKLIDKSIANMSLADLYDVWQPKALSMAALLPILKSGYIRELLVFSSAQSYLPQSGQANYAAASMLQDAYVELLREKSKVPVRLINWSAWAQAGAVANLFYTDLLAKQGIHSLSNATAFSALRTIMCVDEPNIAVLDIDHGKQSAMSSGVSFSTEILQDISAMQDINDFAANAALYIWQSMGFFAKPADRYRLIDLVEFTETLPNYQRYLHALLDVLMTHGLMTYANHHVMVHAATVMNFSDLQQSSLQLCNKWPELEDYFRALVLCAESAKSVVSGEVYATDVLFGDGCKQHIINLYGKSPIAHHYNIKLSELVSARVNEILTLQPDRIITILEIGAGTGASTSVVLAALTSNYNQIQYTFTDISSYLVNQAQQKLQHSGFNIHYQTLDISENRSDNTYDIIIATNVLHAVSDIKKSLNHCREQLNAYGLLLLNEATEKQSYLTVIFGMLNDWWSRTDMALRIPHAPLLTPFTWMTVLQENGYTDIQSINTPSNHERVAGQHIMSARYYKETVDHDISPVEIRQQLTSMISTILKMPVHKITSQRQFAELGLDSISGVSFIHMVNQRFILQFKTTAIFNYTSIDMLAAEISKQLGLNATATTLPIDNLTKKLKSKLMFAGEVLS